MRRRPLQSFTLKLSDLKEYDAVKAEKAAAISSVASTSTSSQTQDQKPSDPSTASTSQPKQIIKLRQKNKQEIRERLGLD